MVDMRDFDQNVHHTSVNTQGNQFIKVMSAQKETSDVEAG